MLRLDTRKILATAGALAVLGTGVAIAQDDTATCPYGNTPQAGQQSQGQHKGQGMKQGQGQRKGAGNGKGQRLRKHDGTGPRHDQIVQQQNDAR